MRSRVYPDFPTYLRLTGRSLTSLSKELGVTVSYLSHIRHGRKVPSLAVAIRIAEYCRIPVESLHRRAA